MKKMNRKLISILLSLVMVLGTVAVGFTAFAGEGYTQYNDKSHFNAATNLFELHTYGAFDTSTGTATCTLCGYVHSCIDNGHVDADENCVCDLCGKDSHLDENRDHICDHCNANAHTWELIDHIDATCTTGDRYVYRCLTCEYAEEETVGTETGKFNHDENGAVLPTSNYGDDYGLFKTIKFEDGYSAPAGHQFNDFNICSVCGFYDCEQFGHLIDPGLRHDENYHWKVCGNCGEVLEKALHTDDNGDGICDICFYEALHYWKLDGHTSASCTSGGSNSYSCLYCGESYTEDIPAHGHRFTDEENGEYISYKWDTENYRWCTITFECAYGCGNTISYTVYRSGSDTTNNDPGNKVTKVSETFPTCTEPGETVYHAVFTIKDILEPGWDCSTYVFENEVTVTTPAIGHDYSVLVSQTQPTCIDPAKATYKCSRCEATVEIETNPSTGVHAPSEQVEENRVEPTCIPGSYDKVIYCSVCGEELSRETVVLPATEDHQYNAFGNCIVCGYHNCAQFGHVINPGLQHDDNYHWKTCKYCDEEIEKNLHADDNGDGHCDVCDYEADHYWRLVDHTSASCTSTGSNTYTCLHCGEEYTEVIPAHGHRFTDAENGKYISYKWDTVNYQSCTIVFECAYGCGKTIEYTVYRSGSDPTNNDPGNKVTIVSETLPTCTEEGETVYHAIFTINDIMEDGWDCSTYVFETEITIGTAALGHDFSELVSATPADCQHPSMLTYKCSRCDATTEMIDEEHPATGAHVDADEDGWCDVCNAETEHDYRLVSNSQPSCTTPGSATYRCRLCGTEYTVETSTELGHFWYDDANEDNSKYVTYSYDEDNFDSCTITFHCRRPGCGNTISYTVYQEANSFGVITKGGYVYATCEEGSGQEYIATFTVNCPAHGQVETFEKHMVIPDGVQEPLGHIYENAEYKQGGASYQPNNDASCTTDGTRTAPCDRCGKVSNSVPDEGSALGHVFENPTVTQQPTCTETGTEVGTCTRCGETTSNTLPALGHSIDPDTTVIVAPTCAKEGYDESTCTRCHEKVKENIVPALGHTPGEPVQVIEKEATCLEDGIYYMITYCTVCGEEVIRDDGHIIPATGEHEYNDFGNCIYCGFHDCEQFGHVINPGYSTDANYHWKTCKYCDEEIEKVLHTDSNKDGRCDVCNLEVEHQWKLSSNVNATCTSAGSNTYICTHCGEEFTETVPALGHQYTDKENEKYINYNWNTETYESCTIEFVCANGCGEKLSYTVTQASADSKNKVTKTSETLPTCDEDGETVYHAIFTIKDVMEDGWDCSKYVFETDVTVTFPALGHDYSVLVSHTQPTCTEPGKAVYKCSRCDSTTEVDDDSMPATGHVQGNPVEENRIEPTCKEPGEFERVYYCQVCEAEISREKVVLPATGAHTDADGDKVCDVCGDETDHDYRMVSTTPPTCTSAGTETYRCRMCGDEYTIQRGPELGHYWYDDVNMEETKYVTFTYDEENFDSCTMTFHCRRPECDHSISYTVYSQENSYGVIEKEGYVNATCETGSGQGYVAYFEVFCPEHSKNPQDKEHFECHIVILDGKEEAKGHIYENPEYMQGGANYQPNNDASCTEDGTRTAPCDRCGKISDKVPDKDSALGHDFSNPTVVPATCTEPGSKTGKCSRCGITTTETIKPLGHDYDESTRVTTAPKCTEDGYDEVYCNRCNKVVKENYVAALGHDFGEWILKTEATCDGNEIYIRYCSRCDATETKEEYGTAKGHEYEWSSYDEDHHIGRCVDCGELIGRPEAHVDADYDFICDKCNAELSFWHHWLHYMVGLPTYGFGNFFTSMMNWFTRVVNFFTHYMINF